MLFGQHAAGVTLLHRWADTGQTLCACSPEGGKLGNKQRTEQAAYRTNRGQQSWPVGVRPPGNRGGGGGGRNTEGLLKGRGHVRNGVVLSSRLWLRVSATKMCLHLLACGSILTCPGGVMACRLHLDGVA